MRSIFRSLTFVALTLSAVLVDRDASAQFVTVCSLGPTGGFNPSLNILPTPTAVAQATKVYSLLCPTGSCGGITVLSNVTTPNAMTFSSGGNSTIVYSPSFMYSVAANYGMDATFGVFAHEMGHHFDQFAGYQAMMSTAWSKELRADAVAGCAIARAKLSTQGIMNVLLIISQYPSPSHPAWNLRLPAIDSGYRSCGGGGSVSAPVTSTATAPSTASTAAAPKKKDSCGCQKTYDDCIDDIQSKEDCIDDQFDGCMDDCQDNYNHPYAQCKSFYCARSGNNLTLWTDRCDEYHDEDVRNCKDDLKSCKLICKK